MDLFLNGEEPLPRRAAWIISYSCEAHPPLAGPWIGKMLEKAADPEAHNAIPRNVFRLLSCIGVPRKHLGMAVTICFDALASPSCPVAVKANAIKILTDAAAVIPDLAGELNGHLERLNADTSAGIRSICRTARLRLEATISGHLRTTGRAGGAAKR
jgi:hypothetical protein